MAEERLHVQVMELEAQVKQLTARPVAIVALDCYLSRLGSVKKWLSSRKCRVILTSDGKKQKEWNGDMKDSILDNYLISKITNPIRFLWLS